jgi:hypothetical protein
LAISAPIRCAWLEHGVGVLKKKGQGVDEELLVGLGEGAAACALHSAHLHHIHDFALISQSACREKLHFDAVIGGLLQSVLE